MRLLAAESKVFLDRMIKGELETRDWQAIARTLDKISQAPLIVDDSPNMTMGEIRAKSRRMKQQHGIQLIVIDYLQLLTSGGKAVESRQQEVSEFSRSIKLLAKELEIPIVAVAQLNRDSERRNDRRPQVADLRESGSLEQDADVVLLIHRDDMFNKDSDRRGLAESHHRQAAFRAHGDPRAGIPRPVRAFRREFRPGDVIRRIDMKKPHSMRVKPARPLKSHVSPSRIGQPR